MGCMDPYLHQVEPRGALAERAERDVESDRILAVCELQEEGHLMKLPLGSTAGTPNFSLENRAEIQPPERKLIVSKKHFVGVNVSFRECHQDRSC